MKVKRSSFNHSKHSQTAHQPITACNHLLHTHPTSKQLGTPPLSAAPTTPVLSKEVHPLSPFPPITSSHTETHKVVRLDAPHPSRGAALFNPSTVSEGSVCAETSVGCQGCRDMDLHSFQSRVVTKDCHVERGEVLVLYCPVECGRNYGVSGAGRRGK